MDITPISSSLANSSTKQISAASFWGHYTAPCACPHLFLFLFLCFLLLVAQNPAFILACPKIQPLANHPERMNYSCWCFHKLPACLLWDPCSAVLLAVMVRAGRHWCCTVSLEFKQNWCRSLCLVPPITLWVWLHLLAKNTFPRSSAACPSNSKWSMRSSAGTWLCCPTSFAITQMLLFQTSPQSLDSQKIKATEYKICCCP